MLRMARPSITSKRFWLVLGALLLANAAWAATKYKVLCNFKGGNDAGGPLYGALALDKNGNLFGTAGGGGEGCGGSCGTVFELSPQENGKWAETVIFRFQSSGTGQPPYGGVIVDSQDDLYGTTTLGGTDNDGTVFALAPGSTGWTESILYNFGSHSNDAGVPYSALVADTSGNLYGAANYPYELSPKPGGGWAERVLYHFHPENGKDGTDGSKSDVPLILDFMGNLYGITLYGGNYSKCLAGSGGCGTVFELTPLGKGGWKERVLHRFAQFKNDGEAPFLEGVVLGFHGNLYGTTYYGGTYQGGTIYELRVGKAGQWQERILYSFRGVEDGGLPGPVIPDGKGDLYGTAGGGGGGCSCGVVFKLAPGANGKWRYTVSHHFKGTDGGQPLAGVTLDGKGNIYGTTSWGGKYLYGVVFEITQ